jgi:hypothetical protein
MTMMTSTIYLYVFISSRVSIHDVAWLPLPWLALLVGMSTTGLI